MNLEQMLKLMGEGTTKEAAQAALDAFNAEAKAIADTETKGLLENKEKLLTQMKKLKENQIPEGFDSEGYKKYTDDLAEFEKKKKELEDKELEGKGQWEALKLKLNDTHTKAIDDLKKTTTDDIAGLTKALNKELVENAAIKAIEQEKGNSLFLLPHMLGSVRTIKKEDGTYGVEVIGPDGKARTNDDQTKPFTVSDLVAELKANEKFAPAFPDGNSGGGGKPNPGGGGGSGINPWKKETKNITEQARITKENPTLAAQYKKSAGVA